MMLLIVLACELLPFFVREWPWLLLFLLVPISLRAQPSWPPKECFLRVSVSVLFGCSPSLGLWSFLVSVVSGRCCCCVCCC